MGGVCLVIQVYHHVTVSISYNYDDEFSKRAININLALKLIVIAGCGGLVVRAYAPQSGSSKLFVSLIEICTALQRALFACTLFDAVPIE